MARRMLAAQAPMPCCSTATCPTATACRLRARAAPRPAAADSGADRARHARRQVARFRRRRRRLSGQAPLRCRRSRRGCCRCSVAACAPMCCRCDGGGSRPAAQEVRIAGEALRLPRRPCVWWRRCCSTRTASFPGASWSWPSGVASGIQSDNLRSMLHTVRRRWATRARRKW